MRAMQCLDKRAELVFLCSRTLPVDGTSLSKHVAVWHLSLIIFYY